MTPGTRNGSDALNAAITLLMQNQAALEAQYAFFVSHLDEDRRRFARIERHLDDIKALLTNQLEILRKLTDSVDALNKDR
jgi:hypothetical protein